MYNVGPNYARPSSSKAHCHDCDEDVNPEWDGAEGEFRCPNCYEPMPDHEETE